MQRGPSHARSETERRALRRAIAHTLLVVLVALVAGGARPAAAQLALPDSLAENDENGDGVLQRSEAPIELLPEFQSLDLDRDGAIDGFEASEYEAARAPAAPPAQPTPEAPPLLRGARPPETFVEVVHRLDRDGDGRLSLAEAPPGAREGFPRADANSDGFVDEQEARAVDERRAQAEVDSLAPGRRTLTRTVTLMDTNGDGKLQKKEAPLAVQRVFEQIDVNADGVIDVDEAGRFDEAARAHAAKPGRAR